MADIRANKVSFSIKVAGVVCSWTKGKFGDDDNRPPARGVCRLSVICDLAKSKEKYKNTHTNEKASWQTTPTTPPFQLATGGTDFAVWPNTREEMRVIRDEKFFFYTRRGEGCGMTKIREEMSTIREERQGARKNCAWNPWQVGR